MSFIDRWLTICYLNYRNGLGACALEHRKKGNLKIIAVFHSDKIEGLDGFPIEIAANPPMTIEGMKKIHELVERMASEGLLEKIEGLFCSTMARALDTASVFSLKLKQPIISFDTLGQHANKDGAKVLFLPGVRKREL